MSATTWLIIAIVGFSLSGIALVAAVTIFIKLNIPAVIGDLSGKTVAREIQAMRAANASSGDKLHKSSRVNIERGKLTEKVPFDEVDSSVKAMAHASKRLDKTGQSIRLKKGETAEQKLSSVSNEFTTESLSSNVGEVDIEERRMTAILSQNRVTDVLEGENSGDNLNNRLGTEVLMPVHQTEVFSEVHQTEVLSEADTSIASQNGTTVLSEIEELVQDEVKPVAFKITKSVTKIHTDEVV